MTLKNKLIGLLKMNGYRTYKNPNCYSKSFGNRDKSFTFLNRSTVEVYEREYPGREGWSCFKRPIRNVLKGGQIN